MSDGNQEDAADDGTAAEEETRCPAIGLLLEPGHRQAGSGDVQLVRRMVDAYDAASVEPLTEAERLALPLAIARQPAWSVGRWVQVLDEPAAVAHARSAAAELPVARAVLRDLDTWQRGLTERQGRGR